MTDSLLLNKILENSPIGICIINADSLVVEMVNEKYADTYGTSVDTLILNSVDDLLAKSHSISKEAISETIQTNTVYNSGSADIKTFSNEKEEIINVTTTYVPISDGDGTITKVAIWMVENDRISGETNTSDDLTVSQNHSARTNNLLNEIPAGIAILSGANFVFESVNPTFQDLLHGKELLGKPFIKALPELAGSEIEEALKKVFEEGITLNFTDNLIPISNTQSGELEQRYFTYRLIPRFSENGLTNGIFIFTYEVTHVVDNKLNLERTSNDLNQIINMLPASVVIIRNENLIVEMINDANLAYWKKTRDEVIGKPFLEILPDLADQPFAGQLRKVMETGEIIDVKESPVMFTEPDGTIRETFVDYTYQPLTGLDGTRDGVLVMSFEITDRVLARRQLEKYAEQLLEANDRFSVLNDKLSKSESRFKFVFQKAPVAIGLLRGPDLIIESANKKILEVWGKTAEIVGLPLADALPEIKGQPFLGILDQVYKTGQPFFANEIKAMLVHEGELKEIFFNVVYQPIDGNDGKTDDILVVAADVTELVNARQKVEKSEAYFKMLADLVPAKISNALPGGEVTFLNKGWLEFAGMSFEDMRDFGYHQMIHPDEIAKFQKGLAAAAESGNPHVSEMRFKNKEGKYIWHLNIASPIFDEEGNITMWIGSTTDIQTLKEEEQRKNDFIGMVSHELKTPLTSVNIYLQLLSRKAAKADDSFLQKAYSQSLKQIKYMTDLINGFLDVSRLESAKLHIEKKEFSLSDLFDEVFEDYKLQYPTHQISFQASQPLIINGDRLKIAQVINNLVGNAVKYSQSGTEIKVKYALSGENIRVTVSDQGKGIKSENLKKLFDRYYRVEQEGNISGFGIGLYLSAEIIKAHGGKIWAESEFGKGSSFYFELPATLAQ